MYDVKKELEDFTQNTVFKSPDIKSQMCKDVATALRFFSENPITRGRILKEGPSWNGMYYVEKEHLDYNGEDQFCPLTQQT